MSERLLKESDVLEAILGWDTDPLDEELERAVKAIPSADKWIPCSERLPSEKGEYLVTYHPCYWDNVKDEIKVGIDTFRGKTTWAKKKFQRIIAWKPLPTPWKGVDDE